VPVASEMTSILMTAVASRPMSMATVGTMWVRLGKICGEWPSSGTAKAASQLASTDESCETATPTEGRSSKMPALTEAELDRMSMSMESSGCRARERSSLKDGVEAWKGIGVMVELELENGGVLVSIGLQLF
jgi:hypothetical protein